MIFCDFWLHNPKFVTYFRYFIGGLYLSILEPVAQNDDIILDIQGYTQTRMYTCGPIAALTVIEAVKGREVSLNRVFNKAVYDNEGMTTGALVSVLRRYGIRVSKRRDMTFDQIAAAIDDGCPIIASVSKGDHWITVVGVRMRPRQVYYTGNTLSRKAARISWNEFRADGGGLEDCLVCSARN